MVVARLSGQPETPRFLHAAVGDLQRIGHIGVSLFHDPGLQWRAAPEWCREMADTPLRPAFKQSPCQCEGCHPEARQAADAGIDAGKTFTLRKCFPPCAQALRPPCPEPQATESPAARGWYGVCLDLMPPSCRTPPCPTTRPAICPTTWAMCCRARAGHLSVRLQQRLGHLRRSRRPPW